MSGPFTFDSANIYTGEVVRKGITVTRNSGTLDITSAWVTIFNAEDNSCVTTDTAATISGADVYALITAGNSIGQRYAIFKFFDDPHTRKVKLNFDIEQG